MAGVNSKENGKKGGRPKGSTTRPQLRDYYTEDELKAFVADLKESAKTDSNIKKFVAEQIFGKAAQPIEGNIKGKLVVSFDPAFKAKVKADIDLEAETEEEPEVAASQGPEELGNPPEGGVPLSTVPIESNPSTTATNANPTPETAGSGPIPG